eukprot:TRINITY_DN1442_c0_g1_i2.p1 TRINITY_DN1442_c0_g1~~TRINITY_DN1442_c0_g1_i2.p1  ORF type:complete len:576 (-),score=135.66 TRINITY_DN1442_c0_g1_i2:47-1774(-)
MTTKSVEYLIIGAGLAGSQMGFFLRDQDYVILEKGSEDHSFYKEQPRHRKLLSINKIHNLLEDKEFNMRHDWNSLISDDPSLLFKNYSKELFPNADDLHKYICDFRSKLGLKVVYNSAVVRVSKNDDGFVVNTSAGVTYEAKFVFVATGAIAEYIPDIPGIEHATSYVSHSINKADYAGKRVAIIGRGNSAFEVADHLAGDACYVHVLSGQPVKLAWNTHFVGDLRAVNNNILDMYQLKSLHSVLGDIVTHIELLEDGTYRVEMEDRVEHWKIPGYRLDVRQYDHVIVCTGWRYVDVDIFDDDCLPDHDDRMKFPMLSNKWETSIPNMYWIGTGMQAIDKKAASGFIHGFRYNVQSLSNILLQENAGVEMQHVDFALTNTDELMHLGEELIELISTTSALYQQNAFLCHLLVMNSTRTSASLYYGLPVNWVLENEMNIPGESNDFVMITLEYGFHNYSERSSLTFIHPSDPNNTKCSAFLHPRFKRYIGNELQGEMHLGESLTVHYWDPKNRHLNNLMRWFNTEYEIIDTAKVEEIFPEVDVTKDPRMFTHLADYEANKGVMEHEAEDDPMNDAH